MTLPRIAIPEPTSTDEAYNQRSLPQYIRAVEAAGGTAVPVPLHAAPAEWAGILASCSGVLLPGSPADVDPARYGQERVRECAAKDEAREAVDDLLLQGAFDQGKPILGICYGLQSLNVWRQGTLIQDLPHADAAISGIVNHQPGREVQKAHPILVTPGSRLSHLVEGIEKEAPGLFVNSSHHQAIDDPGQVGVALAEIAMQGRRLSIDGFIQRNCGRRFAPAKLHQSAQSFPQPAAASTAAASTAARPR